MRMLNQLRYPPDHEYAPMDMLLPTVGMPLPGPPMTDMLLWICPFPLWICFGHDTLPWICSFSTVDMLLPRTGFFILWGKT